MTVKELEDWLATARGMGATDGALVTVIARNGSVKQIERAEPYNGATGTPVLVLK
jgi:hypothetical protein